MSTCSQEYIKFAVEIEVIMGNVSQLKSKKISSACHIKRFVWWVNHGKTLESSQSLCNDRADPEHSKSGLP